MLVPLPGGTPTPDVILWSAAQMRQAPRPGSAADLPHKCCQSGTPEAEVHPHMPVPLPTTCRTLVPNAWMLGQHHAKLVASSANMMSCSVLEPVPRYQNLQGPSLINVESFPLPIGLLSCRQCGTTSGPKDSILGTGQYDADLGRMDLPAWRNNSRMVCRPPAGYESRRITWPSSCAGRAGQRNRTLKLLKQPQPGGLEGVQPLVVTPTQALVSSTAFRVVATALPG